MVKPFFTSLSDFRGRILTKGPAQMILANKLAEERRGRLAAERMLELKQAELYAANRKLGLHARALSEEIDETRAEVATVRDENKRVKSDLTVANQKFVIAERRLWHSIETVRDGFAFYNADNLMIAANTAYLTIFDGLEEITTGVNYVTVLQMLTDEGIVNTGDLSPAEWRTMMTRRWQEEIPPPVVLQLWNGQYVKLLDRRGLDGDMVSLGLNITASVEQEIQLKEAREIAEAANRAKSAFLANMSHEIRTPMNGVVGMSDLLAETGLTEEQRLYVDTIKNSGEALLVIINDVLDFSKIEAKKMELHPEPFDLERCIYEVIMLLQPSARDKGLQILLDYDLFLPTHFVGDPGRLRQVLTNLIGNAVKFTSAGHVLVRVLGITNDESGYADVTLTIEDTGIGIAKDMIDHIFGEFTQVENERNRKFDGTGLGLAISQRLVKLMGGDIWVTSEENDGSCFGFRITMEMSKPHMLTQPSIPDGVRHVMVVDDMIANRTILERQLGQLGFRVTSCASGQNALDEMSPEIDLILSDHIMPEMDGLELCRALRARGDETPMILLSSNPSFADRDPMRKNLHAVMQKPVPRKDLYDKLESLGSVTTLSEFVRAEAVAGPRTTPEGRKMRVLAAEDNKTNRLVFRKMVKDLNIDLQFVGNGIEAIESFHSFQPDLIFMDISMPQMDGKAATVEIRKLEQDMDSHVRIVALTAHAMTGDDQGILKAGLDHYLTKPLRKLEIHSQIIDHCPDGAQPVVLHADDGDPAQASG